MPGRLLRHAAPVAVGLAAVLAAAWLLRGREPEPRVPAASRPAPTVLVSLQVADGLGRLVSAFGAVWVEDRSRNRLVRMDPVHGRVLSRVAVDGRVALAPGRRALWALQRGRDDAGFFIAGPLRRTLLGPLLRIDPRTGRVRDRIRVRTPGGRQEFALGVVAGADAVWLYGLRRLLRVDPARGRVDRTIPAQDGDDDIVDAVLHEGELVLATQAGMLIRHDARTGERLGAVQTGLTVTALWEAGGVLLASASGTLAATDARTGEVRWRRRLGYRIGGAVPLDGALWVQASPPQQPRDLLVGLDPRTGATLARTELDDLGASGLAVVGRRLWLSTAGGRVIVVDVSRSGGSSAR